LDVALILNELWRRRLWVGAGLVIAAIIALSLVFKLPSLERKSTVTSASSTDVLVDTRSSALGSIAIDVNDLATRAAVYARMIGTTAVKQRIARHADVPVDRIAVLDMGTGTAPDLTRRSEASESGAGLSIGATTQEAQPAVKLQALAPAPDTAKRLANASAGGLIDYVASIQEQRAIPARERVVLRQLGLPQTVVLVDKAAYLTAIAAFVGLSLAWCLLVLIASRTATALVELRMPVSAPSADGGNLLVGVWDTQGPDGRLDDQRARRHVASPTRRTRP
jgi:hypothetical protein